MEKQAQNIQEAFLKQRAQRKDFPHDLLDERSEAFRTIKSFDKYSVVLETNNQEQLIFKHAISTVVVSRPFHGTTHAAGAGHGAPGIPDQAE